MSSSVHMDKRKKDILILRKGQTQESDDTTLTAKNEYAINLSEQTCKISLGLYYNGVNSYLFVNGFNIDEFKTKYFEINVAPICLGNGSKVFSADNLKKLDQIDTSTIFWLIMIALILLIDIHKYLLKKHEIK